MTPGSLNEATITRTFGSSIWGASQSVETSGSSEENVMVCPIYSDVIARSPCDEAIQSLRCSGLLRVGTALCADPARNDGLSTLRLLRFPLLDWPAGVAPGSKTAAEMRDRLQAHVLRCLGGERRTQAAGAMKDELLVALEDRLGIGALRIDPEFQHAAGAGECAGDLAVPLDLPGIADIDDHHVALGALVIGRDGIGGADGLDLGVGLVDHRLDAAVDGLGH